MSRTVESDLSVVRHWIEVNTYCAIQWREGWYAKDCIELKVQPKCERCKILARLNRQIGLLGGGSSG